MLNPIHLRTLSMVIRSGSFADAARRLGYTSSAVSQQMSALERDVGTPLFERKPHSIRPTPAAGFIASRTVPILGALQALEEDITHLLNGTVGELHVGIFPTAAERILPAALSTFSRALPQVDIRLNEGEPRELIEMLEVRELDLALVYRYSMVPRTWPKQLRARHLLTEDLLLLLPVDHSAADAGPVDLRILAGERWVSTREGTAGAICLQRLCSTAGFEPAIAHRTDDYAVISGLVSAHLGVAIVPALGYEPRPSIAAMTVGQAAVREVFLLQAGASRRQSTTRMAAALRTSAESLSQSAPGLHLTRG